MSTEEVSIAKAGIMGLFKRPVKEFVSGIYTARPKYGHIYVTILTSTCLLFKGEPA